MRPRGARGVLIYCSDDKCSDVVTMSSDRWPLPQAAVHLLCMWRARRGYQSGFQLEQPSRVGGTDGCCRGLIHLNRLCEAPPKNSASMVVVSAAIKRRVS